MEDNRNWRAANHSLTTEIRCCDCMCRGPFDLQVNNLDGSLQYLLH
uniref:Uncharacterized protein n=1 Tax=Arundo donax TaxID=35708 RepID=A0A0A8ZKW1_ARUDO